MHKHLLSTMINVLSIWRYNCRNCRSRKDVLLRKHVNNDKRFAFKIVNVVVCSCDFDYSGNLSMILCQHVCHVLLELFSQKVRGINV